MSDSESDVPSRIIKENSETFGGYQLSSFNYAIDKSCYLSKKRT